MTARAKRPSASVDLHAFRIYPREDRRGLYCEVRIFKTLRDMRRVLRLEAKVHGTNEKHRKTLGAMQSFTTIDPQTGRKSPCFGRVNLALGHLGTSTVFHEITHAGFAWADRTGIFLNLPVMDGESPPMEREERFCYAVGEMARQCVNHLYDAGFYDHETSAR